MIKVSTECLYCPVSRLQKPFTSAPLRSRGLQLTAGRLEARPRRDAQMAALVLHGEAVLRGHVGHFSWKAVKLQPLDEDGQEEEDLRATDGLADAAPLAQAENHHLLGLHLVDLRAIGAQEAIWVE